MRISKFFIGRWVKLLLTLLPIGYSPMSAGQAYSYDVERVDGLAYVPGHRMVSCLGDAEICNFMGELPAFKPTATAKLGYDEHFLFLHFHVVDKHVSYHVTAYNGPVSRDACVEFFFAPNEGLAMDYFNLEINIGGVALMRHNSANGRAVISESDIKTIEIDRSLSIDSGELISDTVVWQLTCKIPIALLEKYASITRPKRGVVWQGNFYKTAGTGQNRHWMTWAAVYSDIPNFHLPEHFGTLVFN